MAPEAVRREDPGNAVGDPWSALSRWGVTWRIVIACTVTGTAGVLVVTFSALLESQGISLIAVAWGPMLGIYVPLGLGLLSLIVGNWLRSFVPFLQALMFGALGGGLIFVATVILGLLSGVFWPAYIGFIGLLYGFPVFLVAGVGWLLAIWFSSPRGSRVIWPVFGVLFAASIALWIVASLGIFTTVPTVDVEPKCDWSAVGGVMPDTPC